MFKPLHWQQQAYDDQSPLLVLTGELACGKTEIGLAMVHRFCAEHDRSSGFLVRQSKLQGQSTLALRYAKTYTQNRPLSIVEVASRQYFSYSNGCRVFYGGIDPLSDIHRLRSMMSQHNVIFVDESQDLRLADWHWLLSLSRFNQKIVALPDKHFKLLSLPNPAVHRGTTNDNRYISSDDQRLLQDLQGTFD